MIFLRPIFLILGIIPLLLLFLTKKGQLNNPWKKWIDARLLPYLLVQKSTTPIKRNRFALLTLLWSLWVLALSGPAFQTTTPAYLNTNSTVIILDLNSIGSGDQLIKVKAKLTDILNKLKDEQVALVLYDSKGYVLTPLTQDKNILRTMIPSLGADILPTAQNNPLKGFETAERLLNNLNLKTGRILLITAGGFEPIALNQYIQKSPFKTALLFVPQTPQSLPPLQNEIPTHALTADDSDINALINATPLSESGTPIQAQEVQTFRDIGIFIVLISIPFLLYLFRKNYLFILLLTLTGTAQANPFYRPDQQAYFKAQEALKAFQNQNYQQAYDLFYNPTDADALYNAANVLAFSGQIQEAIKLYEQALTLNPYHADALFNKEYLEKQLPQNSASNSSSDTKNQNQNTSENDSQSQPDEQSEQSTQSDSQNSTDTQTDTQNTPENKKNTSQQSAESDSQNNSESSENTTPQSTQETPKNAQNESTQVPAEEIQNQPTTDQETQQLFNRIQEDPSRLLRNRLYQQYRRQP